MVELCPPNPKVLLIAYLDVSFLSRTQRKVEFRVYLRVEFLHIYGRRYDTLRNGHNTCQSLNRAGSSEQVTGHRLRGRDIHTVNGISEKFGYTFQLRGVTDRESTFHER